MMTLLHRKEDETSYPPNFEVDITKRAAIAFDWNNPKIVKDEQQRRDRAEKFIKNMKKLFQKRGMVSQNIPVLSGIFAKISGPILTQTELKSIMQQGEQNANQEVRVCRYGIFADMPIRRYW